ncbi:COX aromatic rich motif-containing protein, partial [Octadecabacter sp.]|nr:COX aromatic rich motif-containing protein [Octadecabacter sp.]
EGFASHYSGDGFSQMRFDVHALNHDGFEDWIANARATPQMLDRETFVELDAPSKGHPVTFYSAVEDDIWERILNMCVGENDLCMHDMMMVDAMGGGGLDGLYNRELYRGLCTADDPEALFAILRPDLTSRMSEIEAAIALLPPQHDALTNARQVQGN